MSLVSVVAGMGILAIAIWVFMKSSAMLSFSSGRMDRSIKSQQVLVGVSGQLQRLDYSQLIKLCGGMANMGTDLTGNCVTGNNLTALANQTVPRDGLPLLNVQLNENGKVVDAGGYCVTLQKCNAKANGQILELFLMNYWKEASAQNNVLSKNMVLRRVRW